MVNHLSLTPGRSWSADLPTRLRMDATNGMANIKIIKEVRTVKFQFMVYFHHTVSTHHILLRQNIHVYVSLMLNLL